MDHQDALLADFDRDHLKLASRCVISKVHKPQIRAIGSAKRLQLGLTNSSDNNITVSGHRQTFTRRVCPNKTAM